MTSAVWLMAIGVFFMYVSCNTYFAIVLDTVEKNRVGAVGGFVYVVAATAGIVTPTVTAFLVPYSGNFESAFLVTGATAVSGALLVALFVRTPKREPLGQPAIA